ncbi:MAG: response regulator [Desulfobulbaceae bacterium]|nr:MAG: response regulator [Desulfobulbaceae bacterium]
MPNEKTILIVEDEPHILAGTAKLLSDNGYVIIEAENGTTAIDIAQTHRPDLILLDLGLPDIDGLDVCHRLKSDPQTSTIYICIFSGRRTEPADQSEGLETGADDFITRPIDNKVLLSRIKAMFRVIGAEQKLLKYTQELETIIDQKIAELKGSEQRYRNIYHNSPDMYVSVDPTNGEILLCNDTLLQKTGYSREEIVGHPIFKVYHEDCFDDVQAAFNQFVDTGKVEDKELVLKRKDGGKIDVILNVNAVKDDDGKIIHSISSWRDITEQKKLQAELHQSQKLESIGTLAGGIAHDFNNILSSILGYTELALSGAGLDDAVRDDLQEVYAAGLRAKELVGQIMTFARQSDEELTPIKVDFIIKEVLKFIRSSIPTTIEIKKNIASNSVIMGSAPQIHRILMNLCTNGAQAMEEAGGTLSVSLADRTINAEAANEQQSLKSGNYIELKVSDTGHGIKPDHLDKVFEPYFTTKGPGEGSGMGLAMVHSLVETYGGKIFVQSNLGEGTTFTIYLPIAKKQGTDQTTRPVELPTGNERILFVDDEKQIARIGDRILSQLGYRVTATTSSEDALEIFQANPDEFDLVITDMTMPKIAGDQLAQEMILLKPEIPIILCSGYSKRLASISKADIGVKAITKKPLIKEELAKTVRKVLDKK